MIGFLSFALDGVGGGGLADTEGTRATYDNFFRFFLLALDGLFFGLAGAGFDGDGFANTGGYWSCE